MMRPVPDALQGGVNAQVLSWLADKSAHDEVATALINASRQLGDVQVFCPDPQQFRYVVVATRGVIFGVAAGMNCVSFRLDPVLRERALLSGATGEDGLGPEWVSFTLFRSDWPAPDLPFWALKAYALARESR